MRYSCPEQMIAHDDLEQRLKAVRAAGFDGVDVRYTLLQDAQSRESIRSFELPVASVYSQINTPGLLDATVSARAQALQTLVECAHAAADVGAENVILVPIFGPPRISLDGHTDMILALERALFLILGKEFGVATRGLPVRIIVEPLNERETHLLRDPLEGQGWCDSINEPTVASMVDTYHCWREQFDSAEKVAAMGDALHLMHFSDSERGLPGEGEVDFAAVVQALLKRNYAGWNGFECRQITTSDDSRALASSLAWVRQLEAETETSS